MTKFFNTAIAIAIVFALGACGGDAPNETAPKTESTTAAVPTEPAQADRQTSTVSEPDGNTSSYRRIEAKLYGNEAPIVILVPADVEIGEDRLIEVKQRPDGDYEFVSLLPQ